MNNASALYDLPNVLGATVASGGMDIKDGGVYTTFTMIRRQSTSTFPHMDS